MNNPFATPTTRGLIFVTTAAIAWGSGGIIAAILYTTSGLGPVAVSFWRTLSGVALLAIGYAFTRRSRAATAPARPATRAQRAAKVGITLVTGVGLAVYQAAYYTAVNVSGVALATVVTLGAGPILIALGARTVIGERLGLAGVLAVGAAPLGLVLMVGGAGGAGATLAWGVGYSLLSAGGYAVVTVLHRALGGLDPARTTLTGFAVATAVLCPLAVAEGLWPTRGHAWLTWSLLLFLGAVPTALAYSLFFASLAALRAATVSVLTLAEPLTATAIAVAALGERLTAPMMGGAVVLLGAVALLATASTWGERTRDHHALDLVGALDDL